VSPLVRALLGAAIGAALLVGLGFGLTRDARVLPGVVVGKRAPAFELEGLDGRRLSSRELRGRPAVINFWASWCSECRKEHPLLMAAHDRIGDRIAFVGIVFQDSAKNARGYLVEMGDVPSGSYPNLKDPGSRVAIDYGVYGVPETFFVDRRGVVVAKRVGRVTPELLEAELGRLLR
jgi:cytochrome c biogenesis protein CcmG/thiol:disulfide interchange protein DsbE